MDLKTLLAVLRAATEEECCDLLTALNKGTPLYSERVDGAPAAKKVRASRPKKAVAASASAAALPSADDGDAPTADAYRMSPEDIDESVCVGRRVAEMDKRWKPAVFRETQCGKPTVDGCDLCTVCNRRQEKFADEEDATKSAKIGWLNRLTEDPPEWCHMLGTTWADEKKPKWLGSASASASEAGDSGEEEAAAAAPAPKKAAKKAVASAEDKAATLAAKKAEKEAEKAAAKAVKDAEKAAAKAEKEAEKEAAKAAKKAEPKVVASKATAKAKAKSTAPSKKTAAVSAKADTAAAVADSEGDLEMIDGKMYMVRKGKVFAYDEITEETGDCVGRMSEDGDSILPLVAAAEESDDEEEEEVLAD
jgi:hypothetical protein